MPFQLMSLPPSRPCARIPRHGLTTSHAAPKPGLASLLLDRVKEARHHLLGGATEPDLANLAAQGELLFLSVDDLQAAPGKVVVLARRSPDPGADHDQPLAGRREDDVGAAGHLHQAAREGNAGMAELRIDGDAGAEQRLVRLAD